MIKEAIDRILELNQKPIVKDGNGIEYWAFNRHPVLTPIPESIGQFETLSGLLSFRDGPETIEPGIASIVVKSCRNVEIVSVPIETYCNRRTFISSQSTVGVFPFDRYMDQETFIIKLQSQFVDNDDKTELLRMVSSITDDTKVVTEDDGVSQGITIEKSFRKKDVTVKPFWNLKPYRTFPEVDQPESRFLLRIVKGPSIALYESDGGMWRVKAAQTVAEYLRNDARVRDLGLSVIG